MIPAAPITVMRDRQNRRVKAAAPKLAPIARLNARPQSNTHNPATMILPPRRIALSRPCRTRLCHAILSAQSQRPSQLSP